MFSLTFKHSSFFNYVKKWCAVKWYTYQVCVYTQLEASAYMDRQHAAKMHRLAVAHNLPGAHSWQLSNAAHRTMCQHMYAQTMLNKYKILLAELKA